MKLLLAAFFGLSVVFAGSVAAVLARTERVFSTYLPLLVTCVVLPALILVAPRLTTMLRGRTQGARGLRALLLLILVFPLVRLDELELGAATLAGIWVAALGYVATLWAVLERARALPPVPRTIPGIRDEQPAHDLWAAGRAAVGLSWMGASGLEGASGSFGDNFGVGDGIGDGGADGGANSGGGSGD